MKTASVSDALAYLNQMKRLSTPGEGFTDLLNLFIQYENEIFVKLLYST